MTSKNQLLSDNLVWQRLLISDTAPIANARQDFRLHLQAELVRRCKANRNYSLRSFARSLGVEPSALSKILAGKRAVSPTMLARLSRRLALSPEDLRHFHGARAGASSTEEPAATDDDFLQVSLDTFETIAGWEHVAILAMAEVEGFKPDAAWIARALDISKPEASAAIERLIRLEMLAKAEDGRLEVCKNHFSTLSAPATAAALRRFQRQILKLAVKALEEVSPKLRDQSTMTMAINPALLPEAKLRIKEFRRSMSAFLEGQPPQQEVYQLTVSLFPVTKVTELRLGDRLRLHGDPDASTP